MSIGQNNPTRMELMKLKRKLTMSQRGHKLLKDKQDELIHQFVNLVNKTKKLREDVDNSLSNAISNFNNIKKDQALVDIYEMLMVPSEKIDLKFHDETIMAVELPKIELVTKDERKEPTYSEITSPIEIDIISQEMLGLLPQIIKLAELEQKILLMGNEIERTRRRVNVIEHVMVPELKNEIHRINMKLEDNERSNTVRIMKSKEIVIEKIIQDRKKRMEK